MSGAEVVIPAATGAGVVIGWLARHFKNGNGKGTEREIVVLLEDIRDVLKDVRANTAGMPQYMAEGRVAIKQIGTLKDRDDLDRQHHGGGE